MMFQIATAQNMTSYVDLFTYMNTINDGWFWSLIVLALFIVVLLSISIKYGISRGLVTAGFITFIVAGFLRTAELIQDFVLYLVVILFALSLMWLWYSES